MGQRIVRWFELELIVSGEGLIITEGVKLPARRGSIFVRNPGMRVEGISPYYCYVIVFDAVYKQSFEKLYTDSSFLFRQQSDPALGFIDLPHVMQVDNYPLMEEYFRKSYENFIFRNSAFDLLNQKALLMKILFHLMSQNSKGYLSKQTTRSIQRNYPYVMQVKKYIDDNPGSNLTLKQLAEKAQVSPNFFCKIFKDIVGTTPIDYSNQSRIRRAKKLLVETNITIKELSYMCGFENETYFFSLFKRLEGISPSRFRENQRLPQF
jgi:AraC-like DNA-binding protein